MAIHGKDVELILLDVNLIIFEQSNLIRIDHRPSMTTRPFYIRSSTWVYKRISESDELVSHTVQSSTR